MNNRSNPVIRCALHYLSASLFVWGTWALMLVAALAFVWQYGSNVPSWDGWDMVPTLTGEQPVTATWLWSQHNEHRVPLPRVILLGLHRITGINFLTPMVFNVIVLGALSFSMIVVAARLRGEISYTDAFFPLLFLHWGHAANLLWGWQVQFISSVGLAVGVLLLIVQSGGRWKHWTTVLTGVCLLLLPLCGANGLVLVPALALWLGYSAVSFWRSGDLHARRYAACTMGLASLALLLVGVYLIGYENVPYHPTSSGLLGTVSASAKVLTIGFGTTLRDIWPFSGLGVFILLLASSAVLVLKWRSQPQERHRAAGLLCFLGGMASLALAIGMGRNGFETRYVTLAAPVWCCVYFIWSIYSPPRVNLFGRMLLLIIACLTSSPNAHFGIEYARDLRHQLGSFERDMEAGVPSPRLINRYWPYLHINQDVLTDYLPMLQRAGVGKFKFLKNDLPIVQVSLPLEPTALNHVTWKDGIAHGTGKKDPYLVFALPENMNVYGIRLKYSYSNRDGTGPCRFVYWKKGDEQDFQENHHLKSCPTGDHANWSRGRWMKSTELEQTTTAWVFDTVKEVKIYPDFKTIEWIKTTPQPFAFQLSELVLLVPANAS